MTSPNISLYVVTFRSLPHPPAVIAEYYNRKTGKKASRICSWTWRTYPCNISTVIYWCVYCYLVTYSLYVEEVIPFFKEFGIDQGHCYTLLVTKEYIYKEKRKDCFMRWLVNKDQSYSNTIHFNVYWRSEKTLQCRLLWRCHEDQICWGEIFKARFVLRNLGFLARRTLFARYEINDYVTDS